MAEFETLDQNLFGKLRKTTKKLSQHIQRLSHDSNLTPPAKRPRSYRLMQLDRSYEPNTHHHLAPRLKKV